MEDFLQNLSSPSWWFGVALVGFLINLASAYLKPVVDNIASRVSSSRKRAIEKERQLFEDRVCQLLLNPISTVELKLDSLSYNLKFFSYAIVSLVIAATGLIVSYSYAPRELKIIFLVINNVLMVVCLVAGIAQVKGIFDSNIFLSEVRKLRTELSNSEQRGL